MSQEYTEDKDVTFRKLSSGRRLVEALMIVLGIFSIYLMAALISFDPADPSWSQTAWHEPIHNLGGSVGAWVADTLFFTFGALAYVVPIIILILCVVVFRQRHNNEGADYFTLALKIIGALALIITSCGLAAFNIDDIYYFASGGVIGSLLNSAMQPWFSPIGATLMMMCIWAAGLTLFTGWSWLTIAEKIGSLLLGGLAFLTNRTRHNSDGYDDDKDDHSLENFSTVYAKEDQNDPLLDITVDSNDDEPVERSYPPRSPLVEESENAAIPIVEQDESIQDYGSPFDEDPAVNFKLDTEALFTGPVEAFKTAGDKKNQAALSSLDKSIVDTDMPTVSKRFDTYDHLENRFSSKPAEDLQNIPTITPELSSEIQPVGPTSSSHDEVKAATVAGSAMVFTPAFDPKIDTPQVKQGIGPELPRPNRVRIPTRRELASYGIRLPSQRASELQHQQEEEDRQRELDAPLGNLNVLEDEISQQGDAHQQYESHQEDRYQPPVVDIIAQDREEEAHEQEMLRKAFEAHQQSRYEQARTAPNTEQISQPPFSYSSSNSLSTVGDGKLATQTAVPTEDESRVSDLFHRIRNDDAFNISPMTDLVNDGPSEPLFTLPPQLEDSQPPATERLNMFEPVADPNDSPFGDDVYHRAQQNSVSGNAFASPSVQRGENQTEYRSEYRAAHTTPVSTGSFQNSEEYAAPAQNAGRENSSPNMDSLIHPFLLRNDQPLPKPTTPLPTLDLLESPPPNEEPVDVEFLEQTARLIEDRLADYRVKATVVGISPGPVVTRFELDLAPGVKAARISNLSRDLARSLSAVAVRVVEVIPGKPYVGLELPNKHRQTVYLREVLDCAKFRETASPLAVVLGKDIGGQPVVADLAKMPHLLVAGTTGSGKSVGVNAMIISILYKAKPEDVKFIMIDPKMLELSVYEGIPHLLTEVVTDMKDAANALRWCVNEMERRYKLMSALGVRNIAGYNERVLEAEEMGRPIPDPFWKPSDSMDMQPPVLEKLPYIVVMVDEFADLIMAVGKKVEELIARLAQKARAAGIHLVLATQRPSVDVITGLIKANIPTRIAFTVSSKIDSRTILDQGGAESLLGMGDMLYLPPNSSLPMRVHGAFVRDQEVHAVVQDWKARGRPQYIDNILTTSEEGEGGSLGLDGDDELDPLFDQAVEFVVEKRRASISGVQRQFRIGYNRAARIIEQMEAQGIVSEQGSNGNREVLAPSSHH